MRLVDEELEHIRRSIDALASEPSWDWNSFLSTLVATLVGAAIAGGIAIWVLNGQRRDQYVSTVRDSAARCLAALLAYTRVRMDERTAGAEAIEVRAEFLMLRAIADDQDRPVVSELRELASAAVDGLAPEAAGYAVGTISTLLASFVRRDLSPERQLRTIKDAEVRIREHSLQGDDSEPQ